MSQYHLDASDWKARNAPGRRSNSRRPFRATSNASKGLPPEIVSRGSLRSRPVVDLSATIHLLGETLGEVLRTQESVALFETEERIRALAKARRAGEPGAAEALRRGGRGALRRRRARHRPRPSPSTSTW